MVVGRLWASEAVPRSGTSTSSPRPPAASSLSIGHVLVPAQSPDLHCSRVVNLLRRLLSALFVVSADLCKLGSEEGGRCNLGDGLVRTVTRSQGPHPKPPNAVAQDHVDRFTMLVRESTRLIPAVSRVLSCYAAA